MKHFHSINLWVGILCCSILSHCGENPAAYEEFADFAWPPAIYGTTEYWSLSPEEQADSLQIPFDILVKITTKRLIEIYLAHPRNVIIWDSSNGLQDGFEQLAGEFNGLDELIHSKDCFDATIEYYDAMSPAAYNPSDHWHFTCLELLLAQQIILDGLSNKRVRRTFEVCTDQYLAKQNYDTTVKVTYGVNGTIALLPVGRYMQLHRTENATFDAVMLVPDAFNYLYYVRLFPERVLNAILSTAQDYLAG